MKFQKRYIILAALVLALGTAVYVNYQFAGAGSSTASKELGKAEYVNATVGSVSTSDEAVQTSALSKSQKDYFASERTKRQETQDKILDEVNEIFDFENSTDEEKSEAEQSVESIIRTFTVQDSIESIIKAKGFSECLCWISDEGVTVIVPDSELNDTSVLIIDDAVISHYDTDYDDISVVGA